MDCRSIFSSTGSLEPLREPHKDSAPESNRPPGEDLSLSGGARFFQYAVLERFAFENICRPAPMFLLAGFTPSSERQSLALPDSAEHFTREML